VTRMLAAVLLFAAAPLPAQHALADGGSYDPSVPTPSSVLGYELGERFTPHHLIVRYAEAVATASPRVTLDTVAMTYEGRPVLLATVTSEANQGRIDDLRAAAGRLADPRGASAGELDRLAASTPTIVWLGYTVHGDEASGVEAALATLYDLAAGQDDEIRMVLDSVIVLIDPVQNPDGHDRHVNQVAWDQGRFGPDPHPRAVVHGHDWHGGRTNHYLFDLNRDWIIHAHPETRGRMEVFRSWFPHVAADIHEMGSSSTYFFAPPMAPVNANVHPLVRKGWQRFARGNADAFAVEGWGFFTREGYDEFYPGYGPSWPLYTGAVGMTYEQGSSEGGAVRRDDGSVLTLREAARHHYTASRATLRTAASLRSERVGDYLTFRREAADNAGGGIRTIVVERDGQGRADSLASLLIRHGIEVSRLAGATTVRGTEYGADRSDRVRVAAGSYVVDLAQPQGVLARTLMEPDPSFDPAFIDEELARRRAGQGDRFYDMTGWALPFLYRVRAWWSPDRVGGMEPVDGPEAPAGATRPPVAGYAYAFAPGSHASIRMLARLIAEEVRVRHAPRAFTVGNHDFPHGAFVVLVNRNVEPGGEADLHARISDLATETGTPVVAVDNALVDAGTDLGSNSVEAIPGGAVALVAGESVSTLSYGAAWYTFDQLMGLPVTRLELDDLTRSLDDFGVVVIPSAFGLGSALGESGTDALRGWVRGGGTLITLDGATSWAASEDGLLRLRSWSDTAQATDGAPLPTSVPGAILRARVDTLSPLLAGVTETEIPVMLFGSRIYTAPDDVEPGEVAIRYAGEDRLRLAGYLWPEVPARVAGTPYLWTERLGAGRVIAFTGDPNFRAMWRGLLPIFANAVLLGPSM
jgi:hypothetical protein